MKRKNNKLVRTLIASLAFGLNMSLVGTAAALVEIPDGAVIDSATLSVNVIIKNNQTVNVHRVTADWSELGVTWNNFGGSYDAAIVNSFVADTYGLHLVDVTDLVQDWVDGQPNYGILLEQGATPFTTYASSEYVTVAMRPKLEIDYTTTAGSFTVTIQRLGVAQEDVADAYIWEIEPDGNEGLSDILYTGLVNGYEKQALIRFDFTTPPGDGGGGHTPGFWQNKNGQALIEPGDIDMLNLLCLSDDDGHIDDFADKGEFKRWLKKRRATNMAYQLSGHLAAMMLNVSVGFVNGDALVYIGEEGDMISIYDLMDAAATALCEDGYTPSGDENRDYQEMLKDALDDANNNLNWVNP